MKTSPKASQPSLFTESLSEDVKAILANTEKTAEVTGSTDATPVAVSGPTAATVVTVEQLNRQIRGTLEKQFDLVWVQGELSNFKPHSSGHFYFSLKDAKAQIKAVMFRGFNSRLKFKPHDGLEVIARGRVTVYEPRGDYQLTIETMEPVGAGALQKAFEQLKAKLQAEGLFDPRKKRPLPPFPKGIALVTSPTGAAIRDMLNILSRRNRGIPVTVIPTLVQGEAAAPQIVESLRKAYRLPGVDVIIVGRGGGSMEDLWAFNHEAVARTIAESPVPIVSAVGHEIDFTIADFVADLRAPTPSAAAELVVHNVIELQDRILKLRRLCQLAMTQSLTRTQNHLRHLSRRLVDPKKVLQDLILKNDEMLDRLQLAIHNLLARKEARRLLMQSRLKSPQQVVREAEKNIQLLWGRIQSVQSQRFLKFQNRLFSTMAKLDTLSPLRTLDRGYALVYQVKETDTESSHSAAGSAGQLVQSTRQVRPSEPVQVRVADGWIDATVTGIRNLQESRKDS